MKTTNEFDIKLERIYRVLEQEQLYACYLKRQDNFAWLTCGGINYVSVGDIGNCGLLITRDKRYAITNNIEGPRMREEEKLEEMGFQFLEGIWHDNGFEQAQIKKICEGRPVGYDHGSMGFNISSQIQKQRFSLTPEEVKRYLEGGKKSLV